MPYADQWWWWPGGSPQSLRPVLFFPPAGGDQTSVTPLVHHLAGARLGALRLPGRGLRWGEPLPPTIGELATRIASSVAAMTGPAPLLVGHSFGGLLAFAVAQELDRLGRSPARLVVVASVSPSQWHEHVERYLAEHGLPDQAAYVHHRVTRLVAASIVAGSLTGRPELAADVQARLTADIGLSCTGVAADPVSCPITSVVARDDVHVARRSTTLWNKATDATCDELTVLGGHFFYREEPVSLTRILHGELRHLDGEYQIY